jgi:hypothetical protein
LTEKLTGCRGWAVRGVNKGSIFFDKRGWYIKIAVRRSTLLKAGHKPENIVRVEIGGVQRKKRK